MALGTLGRYQLLSLISEGGMGEIYLARLVGPAGFEREVAIKIVRWSGNAHDEPFVRLFDEEAKIAAKLTHPNLIRVYDFGSDGDRHFLCMELVDGKNFAELLARCQGNSLAIGFAVQIVLDAARGLDFAHRLVDRGEPLELVHRDISPENLLISYDGEVKLTDFGTAKIRRATPVTRSGVVKGKFRYMSPEQITCQSLDQRSDLFSLGIVLWEAIVGGHLFKGTTDAEIAWNVQRSDIAAPSRMREGVPVAMDAFFERALDRSPRGRFQTAREFAEALHGVAAAHGLLVGNVELGRELRRRFPEKVKTDSGAPIHEAKTDPVVSPRAILAGGEITHSGPTRPDGPAARTLSDAPGRSRAHLRSIAAGAGVLALAGFAVVRLGASTSPSLASTHGAASPAQPPPALVSAAAAPAPAAVPPVAPAAAQPALPPAPSPIARALAKLRPRKAALRPGAIQVLGLRPWAEIAIDRVSAGYSPKRSIQVPAGRHLVVLRNPDTGLVRRFEVRVPAGGRIVFRGELRSLQPTTGE